MTGPMARYVQPVQAREPAADITQRPIVAGQRGLTRSARAVTQSVAVVAAVMRSAKQPAVFVRGLMPSRLRRWWWKACDTAWDVVGALTLVSGVAVVAFLAYMLVASAFGGIFG
jgi:hypothetical protein